jgi:hypothetical protein
VSPPPGPDGPPPATGARPARRPERYVCTICGEEVPYAIWCHCGFMLCPACLAENAWGMTCNHITWECPDCGAVRSF